MDPHTGCTEPMLGGTGCPAGRALSSDSHVYLEQKRYCEAELPAQESGEIKSLPSPQPICPFCPPGI